MAGGTTRKDWSKSLWAIALNSSVLTALAGGVTWSGFNLVRQAPAIGDWGNQTGRAIAFNSLVQSTQHEFCHSAYGVAVIRGNTTRISLLDEFNCEGPRLQSLPQWNNRRATDPFTIAVINRLAANDRPFVVLTEDMELSGIRAAQEASGILGGIYYRLASDTFDSPLREPVTVMWFSLSFFHEDLARPNASTYNYEAAAAPLKAEISEIR